MAISKDIQTEYQTIFKYHRISDVNIFTVDNDIQIRIVTESYASKEARMNGARAVYTENIIEHADFAMAPFYALLKAKFPMFADGEDDFDDAWKEKIQQAAKFTQQTPQGDLLAQWEESELIEEETPEEAGEESEE